MFPGVNQRFLETVPTADTCPGGPESGTVAAAAESDRENSWTQDVLIDKIRGRQRSKGSSRTTLPSFPSLIDSSDTGAVFLNRERVI